VRILYRQRDAIVDAPGSPISRFPIIPFLGQPASDSRRDGGESRLLPQNMNKFLTVLGGIVQRVTSRMSDHQRL